MTLWNGLFNWPESLRSSKMLVSSTMILISKISWLRKMEILCLQTSPRLSLSSLISITTYCSTSIWYNWANLLKFFINPVLENKCMMSESQDNLQSDNLSKLKINQRKTWSNNLKTLKSYGHACNQTWAIKTSSWNSKDQILNTSNANLLRFAESINWITKIYLKMASNLALSLSHWNKQSISKTKTF